MKKIYVNPQMRVVEIECDNALMESSIGFGDGDATPGNDKARRSRLVDDWDEEDW